MSRGRTQGIPHRVIVLKRLAASRGCEKYSFQTDKAGRRPIDNRQNLARTVQQTCLKEMAKLHGPEPRRIRRAMAFAKARSMRKQVNAELAGEGE